MVKWEVQTATCIKDFYEDEKEFWKLDKPLRDFIKHQISRRKTFLKKL